MASKENCIISYCSFLKNYEKNNLTYETLLNIKLLSLMFDIQSCLILRKHAYSNILKFLPPKYENFQMKNSDNFHISAQNIDCGYLLEPPRRGGSNESPQLCF